MARQSSNPVFQRSTALHESLRGTGHYAPTADEVGGIYNTPARLTFDDIVVKTGLLLGIIVVTGTAAWVSDAGMGVGALAGIAGFVLALVNMFKRQVSPPLVMAYAALEGVFLGVISHVYNDAFQGGIVTQAVIGTATVFGAVLLAYKSGTIRNTPKFRKVITTAFLGLFGLLVVNLLVGLFGDGDALGIRGDNLPLSILFSVAFITFGALTFILDFDQADQMVRMGVDSRESWRIAFGLVVGLVCHYLEVLRLLSYLQGRD
ncbi:MAG: hypothetical protein JWM64_631 [Frankiales bacterium]|nr:hypothetical protein [Frankiales bacterium]